MSKKENAFCLGFRSFIRSNKIHSIRKHKMLYFMLLPALAFIVIFSYVPMFGIIVAFQDFILTDGVFGSEMVGFKVFREILFSPASASYLAFRNTIYISLIRILTNFPIILIYALLINEINNKKFKGIVQSISYIPFFISWISVGGMSYNLFAVDEGLLNKLLAVFGKDPITWYAEPKYWWSILTISSLWKGMGWSTLIYISSIGSIDAELYDACTIDGGGRFRQMVSVTLPGIMNVIMLQLILDLGSIMSDNYDQIMAMINSSQSLNSTTEVVGSLEYDAIVNGSQYSKATAYALIRGIIGLSLVLVANNIAKKTDNEGVL